MKHVLIATVLFLTVTGCLPEKKKDVEPDLAGSYQVSQVIAGPATTNYPDSKGTTAVAVVSRPNDSQIEVTVNETRNGSVSPTSFGTLTIRKASGKDYDVFNPNTNARIGSINGTDFTLDFTSNGQRFALISRK